MRILYVFGLMLSLCLFVQRAAADELDSIIDDLILASQKTHQLAASSAAQGQSASTAEKTEEKAALVLLELSSTAAEPPASKVINSVKYRFITPQ